MNIPTWEEIADELANPQKIEYPVILHKDMVPFVQAHLGDKCDIIEEYSPTQLAVTLTIENSLDLLAVFHSGIKYGIEFIEFHKKFNKIN